MRNNSAKNRNFSPVRLRTDLKWTEDIRTGAIEDQSVLLHTEPTTSTTLFKE
jgi:hypothetical protein